MLVLTRTIGEQVIIDGGICITVVAINGSHVRIGITAPREVPILRGELLSTGATAQPRFTPA